MIVKIREADKIDIQGILNIQKEYLISKSKIDPNKGFLVYALEERELKEIISKKLALLIVGIDKNEVVGYALAYNLEDWKNKKPSWESKIVFNKKRERFDNDKVIYFRHIARKEGYDHLGERLEEEIYKLSKKIGRNKIIAEILEKPYENVISKKVHMNRDFRRIGKIVYEDKTVWGVYERDLI